MDHLFEQKLVRENQQLQLQLVKLNKQIEQLKETMVQYEMLFSDLLAEGKDVERKKAVLDVTRKYGSAVRANERSREVRGGELLPDTETPSPNSVDNKTLVGRAFDAAVTKAGRAKEVARIKLGGAVRRLKTIATRRQGEINRRIGTADVGEKLGTISPEAASLTRRRLDAVGRVQGSFNFRGMRGPNSAGLLARQGLLPTEKFGTTPAEQQTNLANLTAANKAKRAAAARVGSVRPARPTPIATGQPAAGQPTKMGIFNRALSAYRGPLE